VRSNPLRTGPRAPRKAVIERWNEHLAERRDMLWSPTIRAALIAGTQWLDVHCPGWFKDFWRD
jgi:hypothetical protein